MKLIDAHTHTEFRSANDYWYMSLSGVSTIINPCTFSGFKKTTKELYHEYFNRLLNFESWRAKQNGIKMYAGVGIDPEDFVDVELALEVLDVIPDRYFDHENLCCLGEIGMDKGTLEERLIFEKQLEIVGKYEIPAIIHTPQVNQMEIVNQIIAIVNEMQTKYPNLKNYLLLDELKADIVPSVIDTGFAFYGVPVGPLLDSPFIVHRKATGQELLGALKQTGGDRLILNSALAWGYGDCLALSKIKLYLELQDVSDDTLNKIFYENALSFFSQWRDIR